MHAAHEAQAAVRAYRMGQTKPVFVYRLIATGTMENFVYDRQVNKAQLAKSVVDDTNVTRLFSSRDLQALFRLEHPDPISEDELEQWAPKLDISAKRVIEGTHEVDEKVEEKGDDVMKAVLTGLNRRWVVKVKRHDDACEEDNSEELTKEEEAQAQLEEEEEEKALKDGHKGPMIDKLAGAATVGSQAALAALIQQRAEMQQQAEAHAAAGTKMSPSEAEKFAAVNIAIQIASKYLTAAQQRHPAPPPPLPSSARHPPPPPPLPSGTRPSL